jgi:hypothetical protein
MKPSTGMLAFVPDALAGRGGITQHREIFSERRPKSAGLVSEGYRLL